MGTKLVSTGMGIIHLHQLSSLYRLPLKWIKFLPEFSSLLPQEDIQLLSNYPKDGIDLNLNQKVNFSNLFALPANLSAKFR